MLLLRNEKVRVEAADRLNRHITLIEEVFAGKRDLRALHAAKLADALAAASRSKLYANLLPEWTNEETKKSIAIGHMLDPDILLDKVFTALPLLDKRDLSRCGYDALARKTTEFLHYYESSGTTSDPIAAPKALDDLLVNTANIGEMWGRLLSPDDVALILIIAPLAPAPYQFEKVLEYLGVMSFRPWVDYIDGNYTKVLQLVHDLSANVFVGAPSRLLAMIQFALRRGMPAPRFDHLLLIAEQTGPSFLRHLERLTGAQAYVGSYGSSETGTIAVTCERGQLHLQMQSYLLELHTEDGIRTVDGTSDHGELVVTTLDLPARPLLRYRTGDLVEVDGKPCACGLALPVMRTQGRAQDVLMMPGGTVRQNDLEAALWADGVPGPMVLNYMLVIRGEEIVCLVTTNQPADTTWASETAQRLGVLFPTQRLTVRPVDVLSPLSSLSGDLGWKLSRVLDLGDERMWCRLPAPVAAVVRETVDQFREV
jgi:phenylacetate-CoA ligase